MQIVVTDTYNNNSKQIGQSIYSVNGNTNNTTMPILNDNLIPIILSIQSVNVGSTSTSIKINTRTESTIYYTVAPKGC